MSKHTEGELQHVESKLSIYRSLAGQLIRIVDDKNNFVCRMENPYSPFFDYSNAARLVKCWNMHDELMHHLKECVKELREVNDILSAEQYPKSVAEIILHVNECEKLIKQSEQ